VPPGQQAAVTHITDGDTIEVEIDGRVYDVRYIGIDTPERDEPFYEEARQANLQLVEGKTVTLVKDVSETDEFGRLLRYVYLPDGTFVNAELIRQGLARVVTFPPDVAMIDYLVELQKEAREKKRGLWAETAFAGSCGCEFNRYNCSDFTAQAEAQLCFDFCREETGEDVHRLDGGGDGFVCESLP
jgi:endonuclease YncB( thermonuclease family)